MTVVVTTDGTVYCDRITFLVPIGTAATDLFDGPVHASAFGGDGVWLPETARVQTPGSFAFTCTNSAYYRMGYPLKFVLSGTVNDTAGTATIGIRDNSGDTDEDMTPRAGDVTAAKSAPQFTLTNFYATKPENHSTPISDFNADVKVRLAWESTGTYFRLYQAGDPTPVYEGSGTTWTIDGGLTRDTTFVLAAQQADATLYDSISLTVSDPTLDRLTVGENGLTVGGYTRLADVRFGGGSGDSVGATTVTATENLHAGTATVLGDLSAQHGNVAVTAVTDTFAGVQVKGLANADALLSSYALVAKEFYALTATMNIMGTYPTGPYASGYNFSGTAVATTDGFLVFVINGASQPDLRCFAYARIDFSPTVSVWSQGGTVNSHGRNYNNPSTMTLPIKAGSSFTYTFSNNGDNEVNTVGQLYFFPFGAGQLEANPQQSSSRPGREQTAQTFVRTLENGFGTALPDDTRAALTALLLEL
ncbi:hypothetical protein ACIA8K_35485 [Catenuloplanes sp. NPDC051500]|uniref:hypothetical protein n=1 Tax=Catenuloplanes sp. NPDC051500 TaxID=3363959 RepID=UPI0037985CC7